MKYYAMLDGRREGPYDLAELAEAGVGPSTYVWCKGMDDWKKADEVADICRFWRQRLVSLKYPSTQPSNAAILFPKEKEEDDETGKGSFRSPWFPAPDRDSMVDPPPELYNQEPPSTLMWAVLTTLLCMPFTGIAAIYFSIKASREWVASHMEKGEEADKLKRAAWDHSRQARMLTGISLFLGMIIWAFILRFVL